MRRDGEVGQNDVVVGAVQYNYTAECSVMMTVMGLCRYSRQQEAGSSVEQQLYDGEYLVPYTVNQSGG